MVDYSHLDKKYFLDNTVYNCPFCNRRNIAYKTTDVFSFDWTTNKKCYGFIVQCSYCKKDSMHLSFIEIAYAVENKMYKGFYQYYIKPDIEIDDNIFYSVPTSYFIMDNRVPNILRELITEAEGCLKMNFLTGASACMRKAIYELLIIEKAAGHDYESRIKFLKGKYKDVDASYFDILSHIQDMTSDKIHEQSWEKWESGNLKLIIETLKSVLYEIYVLPKEKEERSLAIEKMRENLVKDKKQKKELQSAEEGEQ